MKNTLTILIILFTSIVFSKGTLAQITFTSADASAINAVGNKIINHFDSTTTSVDIGSPGATSWDFSALNSHYISTFTSVLPSSTPYFSSDFSTSNVAFYFDINTGWITGEGWAYSTQDANNYEQNGIADNIYNATDTMVIKSIYSPAQLDLTLPFTYNSQWGSDFVNTTTNYVGGVPIWTVTENHTENVIVDAYGPMTMPGGIVLQALRIRRDDRYINNFSLYMRTISYSFLTEYGSEVDIIANDTTAPNSGIIQTDYVTWTSNGSVGIENETRIPSQYSLSQNYPNPFNPSTTIRFQIPNSSFVNIKVYDVLGNEVAIIINEEKPAGTYKLIWTAENLPSGIYFYKIQAGSFVETKKMILLK